MYLSECDENCSVSHLNRLISYKALWSPLVSASTQSAELSLTYCYHGRILNTQRKIFCSSNVAYVAICYIACIYSVVSFIFMLIYHWFRWGALSSRPQPGGFQGNARHMPRLPGAPLEEGDRKTREDGSTQRLPLPRTQPAEERCAVGTNRHSHKHTQAHLIHKYLCVVYFQYIGHMLCNF